LSHYAAHSAWFVTVQQACKQLDIELDAVGSGLGKLSDEPEKLMLDYDLIFAVDRTALEATAVGNAVILCGQPGLGPMVKSSMCDELHRQYFGRKWLNQPVTLENVLARISEYDAAESHKASQITRQNVDSAKYLDSVVSFYEQALRDFQSVDRSESYIFESLKCASGYVASLSAAVRTHIWGNDEFIQLKIQRDGLQETAERRRLRLENLEQARHEAVTSHDRTKIQLQETLNSLNSQIQINRELEEKDSAHKAEISKLEAELASLRGSKTMIVKNRVMQILGLNR
jgi:hypothetical protein